MRIILTSLVFTLGLFMNLQGAERPNILLICIDDLRPELNCFGKNYIQSPNIDKLASEGRRFFKHYVQAPTCGASRYTLLTGRYGPSSNNALFQRAERIKENPKDVVPSLPAWLRQKGYTTVSVGKVSHYPGGRGGDDWDDGAIPEMPLSWDRHLLPAGPWQHPRGSMHGLAHGEIRGDASVMDVFQSVEGPDTIYPDGLIVDEALKQMDTLAKADKPFFLAVGIIRPHLPFGAPAKFMKPYRDAALPTIKHPGKPEGKTTWHTSSEFMKYNRWGRDPNEDAEFANEVRKHYAACVTYADAQVGKVIGRLESLGLKDDTVIVLWGDHGWHLGEHSIWGKHALFEESLHSPLIIVAPGTEKPGAGTTAMVETLDIFPTLCELIGLPTPKSLHGSSLVPLLNDPGVAAGHSAIAYAKNNRTIRTNTHRLIVHEDGFMELYDHRTKHAETRNLAQQNPDLCQALLARLSARLKGAD
ncbi:MAG: sulfatase [Verrucomicrobia bacterium]|nr:sulfatase [Verrucomicrobiota bacterium]